MTGLAARLRLLFEIDLRSLAAFRIVLAVALLASLLVLLPDVGAFLTDGGILPRSSLLPTLRPGSVSLFLANGSYPFALALVLVHILAALALLVGYRTRLATIVCWLLAVSLDARNFLIVQGGDELIALLLFWAMFLPTGAVFSVDAALDQENRREAPPVLSIATVGLLLQALSVYFFGALLKSGPEWIPQGTAVLYAISLDTYATPFGHWLRQFPSLTYPLTFYVWFLEILSPVLLFFPDRRLAVRSAALVLLMSMHLAFRLCINIGHFWLASLASLAAYIPGAFWTWLGNRYFGAEQERIVIYYDRDCGFCRKISLILREFFLPRRAGVLPAQDVPEIGAILERETSWVVTDAAGNRHLRWDALVFVVRQSIAARPLAWLLSLVGLLGLGDALYNAIGRNRQRLGWLSRRLLPERSNSQSLHPAVAPVLVVVILLCLLLNARDHFSARLRAALPPAPLVELSRAFGLTQRWSLFAPRPMRADVLAVVTGLSEDGRSVDVGNSRFGEVSRETPRYLSHTFRSYRWRKFLNRVAQYPEASREYYYSLYAAFLCRQWNERRAGGDRLLTVSIALTERSYVAVDRSEVADLPIGTWPCAGP
jgi:predicted DCC family thiol-disulfide oxidoreductase YuxK